MQEILKNALRATIEAYPNESARLPPVSVEVMKGSFDVTIKVSDQGGGMTTEQLDQVWRYGYTTGGQQAAAPGGIGADDCSFSGLCGQDARSMRQLAGYGFGL